MARLTVIAMTLTLIGGGIAWLDSRHASASDMSQLRQSIEDERLDRIEFEIEDIERQGRALKRLPVEEQNTPEGVTRELDLKARRDRYLRKREKMLLEMDK
jgi:hypothetical protein